MDSHETQRILDTWRRLSGCNRAFRTDGVQVHVGEHQIAPDGYIGAVRFGDAAVVGVRPSLSELVAHCDFVSVDPSQLTTVEAMTALLGTPAATLGPAVLAFRSTSVPLAESTRPIVGPVPFDHAWVQQVVDAADDAEVTESGLSGATSGLFVAVDQAGVGVSACGFVLFGGALAHLGVLTATQGRGHGWGRASATAAIAAASEAGFIPQWRATVVNEPSIWLAKSLGFEVLGQQVSFKPQPA